MSDFKYLAIVDWARETIKKRGFKPGHKFFSETELCGIHNVSRQTVRQALTVMENERLIQRRQGSGTFVLTPGMNTDNRSITVGVISTYFNDYIFPCIITGIEQVLVENNMTMRLATTRNLVEEEARTLKTMLAQDVRGLIVEPSKSALPNPNSALYEEIRMRNIPLVFFNAKYPYSDFPCVAIDDVAAGSIVAEHLISLGHREISTILLSDDIQGHKRYRGFIESLKKSGIPGAEQRTLWFSTKELPSLFEFSADRILTLLKDSTAIICYNDSLAVRLLEFCKHRGISVPDELSVVGIDDSNQARICEIPLTTVRHPQRQLGECVANVLLEMIANPSYDAEDVLFTPELVVRDSSAAWDNELVVRDSVTARAV